MTLWRISNNKAANKYAYLKGTKYFEYVMRVHFGNQKVHNFARTKDIIGCFVPLGMPGRVHSSCTLFSSVSEVNNLIEHDQTPTELAGYFSI